MKKGRIFSVLVVLILLFNFFSITSIDLLYTSNAIQEWKQLTESDFKEGTISSLSIEDFGGNTELKLDSGQWFDRTGSVYPDEAELGEIASVYDTDKAVYFGWDGKTWIYDNNDYSWTQKITDYDPGIRDSFDIATIIDTDKVMLFGGRDEKKDFLNDTWIYDLSDNNWSTLEIENNPHSRSAFSIETISSNGKILLFGGYNSDLSNKYFRDTWIFDYNLKTWTQIPTSKAPEASTRNAIASIFGTSKVVLFGGHNFEQSYFNETWIFDYDKEEWNNMNPIDHPSKRKSHSMSYLFDTDRIILFGGLSWTRTYENDTWVYDLSENSWTKKNVSFKKVGRGNQIMATLFQSKEIVMYGGIETYKYIFYTDTFIFDPNYHNSHGFYTSKTFDTGAKTNFKKVIWSGDTPTGTNIAIQIRTSTNFHDMNVVNFVGPDGLTNSYYEISESEIWSGHNGYRWIQFKVNMQTNDVKKTPILRTITISFNNIPITTIASPSNNSILTDSTPTFGWNYYDRESEPQSKFQVIIDETHSFKSIDYDSGFQNYSFNKWNFPENTGYSSISDGTWYWKVRTQDIHGDWSEFSETWTIIVDSTEPNSSIKYPLEKQYYQFLDTISGVATDPGFEDGIKYVEISIEKIETKEYWNGDTWNLEKYWILVSGTDYWFYGTENIEWSSGEYRIQSRAIDNNTNTEIPNDAITFYIDHLAPLSNVDYPEQMSFINLINEISINATDLDGSGINEVEINIKRNVDNYYWSGTEWTTEEFWLPVILNENWIYFSDRITWKSDLQYTIRSKAIDKTNNTENPNSGIVFMYDNKPPENLSIIINNNDVKTDSNRINLKLNSEDTGSGNYQMSFSYDKITWTELEDFQFTKDLIIPKNKGTIEIYFKVRDYAGNEAEPVGVSIIIDENSNKDKINWVLIGIITVVIMIVAIILFFLFIKPRMGGRNESEDKKKEEPQKPVEPDQKQYDSQQNQYQSLYNQSPSQQRQQKFPPYQ